MSARTLVAIVIAFSAGSATSLPFVLDGPLSLGPLAGRGGGAHAGHGDDAAAGTLHDAAHAVPGTAADDHSAHAAATGPGAAGAHADHAGGLGDQPGMQRPAFPPASGTTPTSTEGLERITSQFLEGDDAVAELASSGSGTLSDPYVLRGLHVAGELNLLDTDACVVIAENYIAGQLTLNWNGQCVWVHHNFIHDLRVNENLPRTGYGTGGLIEQNKITIIGQLRHYDGEFRSNVVGPGTPDDLFDTVLETVPFLFADDTRVANVDGFNQGLIHHNTFYGSVDLDLHGHHHGTGFFAPHSHYHGDSSKRMAEHVHDHADRWTSVAFTDNTIVDAEGYGLRYEDEAHAGDDRRATSEDLDVLDEPHVHHTDITLARNKVTGGQIWVDVFNADDPRHEQRNPGTLTIADNTVETHEREDEGGGDACLVRFGDVYNPRTAMHVMFAKEVQARITGNALGYVPLPAAGEDPVSVLKGAVREVQRTCSFWPDEPVTAIRLEQVRDADLLIQGNRATGFAVGVGATFMDDKTTWRVVGNDFGTPRAIEYDDTVANEPTKG